jgi:fumarate hydratase class II
MAENYRIEKDSMGELEVPQEALYGAQTQRAINNFRISGLTLPTTFIKAIALILPRSSGHSTKRVISKTEVNYENTKRINHTHCSQQIYRTV